jgi:autotransporter-associated beta strand protein
MLAGPGRALAQRPLGIDVSDYQGSSINWTSVKGAGIVFAWTKATEGASGQYVSQASFTINENNGKAAGVYMGAYHYCHPEQNTPAAEASYFWSVAGNYIKADGVTLMPMLDVEGSAFSGNVGASSISDWVNQWCTDIVQDAANAGVAIKPTIYVSACNACYFNSTVAQWLSGIADYNGESAQTGTAWSTCTSCEVWGSGVWNTWQYISTGTYAGISDANVDHDVFNGTSASLVTTMVAIASTNSAIFYWDPQGTTGANPYTGSMTGTWENSKWSYGNSGLATPVGWVDGKAVCFGVHTGTGTPAFTVTMNSSHVVAGFFDGALTPNSCDVTITGSGIIDLASGPQALDADNSSDGSLALLRINCVIAGNGQLYPEGNGQSFLHGANTFTGGTTLGYPGVPFSGTVNFNNGSAFGTGPIALTNTGTGGALVLEGTAAVTVTNPVTVGSATTNNIVGNAAGLTFSGNWSMGSHLLTLGTGATAGNQTIISGVVSGTAGLTVYNSGTLVLSGVNTYSGTTAINSPAVLTIGGAGQMGSGSYAGNIANGGTFIYDSSAGQTLSGVISGAGALVQNGSGQLTLSGANTFTGKVTVSGTSRCIIQFGADNNLGTAPGSVVANQITLNGGVGVGLRVTGNATINANRGITLSGSGGSVEATSGKTVIYPGIITGSGNFSSGGGVTLGYGTNVLSGANTYTGTTTITAGTLQLGANNTLPTGTALTIQADDNGTGGGGVLYLNSYSQTLGSLASSTSNGGTNTPTVNLGTGALTINQSINTTFAGRIAGSGTLTKAGNGTLTLSGASTYAGGTTISGGRLEGAVSGSIAGNVNNPAGTLQLDNASAMASAANLTLASAPSVGAVNLNFSGTQTINALYFGTTQKAAGTWAASGATHNNGAFTGSGVLNVTTGPASSTALSLTSGFNPSTYGNSLTFTATVTGNSPGGTVQFKVDGIAAGSTVTLVGGSAALVVSTLAVSGSPHQITAYYSGDDNNNPSDSSASPIAQAIMAKSLTAGLTGTVSKTYNGTTAATLAAGNYSMPGVVSGDTVTLNNPGGTYDTRNVGTGKTVSVTGLAISGLSAGNYTLSSASASAAIGTINQTNITVTAAANTKPYDGTTSAAVTPLVTGGGIQSGDTGSFTETYDTAGVGTGKTLTPSGTIADGNGGANYLLSFVPAANGTITLATTAGALTASPNPSLPGANVTFAATVTNAVPGGPAPAGNVQFKTNGVPLGDPVALNTNGVATLITNSLPHGSNTVSAEYAGDGTILGLTNSVVQIVNTPPSASNTNATASQNQPLMLSDASLLSLAQDPDGDSLSITSAGPTSTNGGTVTLSGANVTYQPLTGFVGADLFSFVVSDPYGASGTGTVLVTVSAGTAAPPIIAVPPSYDSGSGSFRVTFAGSPNYPYTIQWAPSPTGPWSFLQTATADTNGLFEVIDTEATPPLERFYRTVYP